jgi:hypothetical protein
LLYGGQRPFLTWSSSCTPGNNSDTKHCTGKKSELHAMKVLITASSVLTIYSNNKGNEYGIFNKTTCVTIKTWIIMKNMSNQKM